MCPGLCPPLPVPRLPWQHLALPVDADVVGVLPAGCAIHHGCCSLRVEVETLCQAVEGAGFDTPWARRRHSHGATQQRKGVKSQTQSSSRPPSLLLAHCTAPSAQEKEPTKPHRGTRALFSLISTKSRPLNRTPAHGKGQLLLHSLADTCSTCQGRTQTDLLLSGVGLCCISWHFRRCLLPVLQRGKLRQQLLSHLSKAFQLLEQSNC